MAEALGLTASIITVLQLTQSVLSVCYDYGAALKGSSWELTKVKDELEGFRTIVQHVEPLMRAADLSDPSIPNGRLPTLKALCEPEGVLQSCRADLKSLEDKLKGSKWTDELGPRRKALLQSLKWPFQERDTRKFLERIARYKDILTAALEMDHTRLTLAIHTLGLRTNEDVHSIKDVVEETRDKANLERLQRGREEERARLEEKEMKLNQKKRLIENWLSPPDLSIALDPSINHRRAQKIHHEGTGSWFLDSDHFARWEQQRILTWLYGIPGCGKTVLSSTIIEAIRQKYLLTDDTAVLYFYFDFNESQKQKPEFMVRSLILQLLDQSFKAFDKVKSLYVLCSEGRSPPELTALCETLVEVIQELDETFIVLDALDECGEREELFEVVSHIRQIEPQKTHMLLASRRLPDIEEALRPLLSEIDTVRVGGDAVNSDILTYISQRLRDDQKLKRWKDESNVQEEIRRRLMEKADGMFRWTVCQLEALQNCTRPPAVRKALNNLPKSLDETYSRILCGIPEEYADEAFTMLRWLSYSIEPLSVYELAEAVLIDIHGDPRVDRNAQFPVSTEVLSILSVLVTHEGGGRPVRFAHFSVKEYLLSDRILSQDAKHFSIQRAEYVAEATCAYLLHVFEDDSDAKLIGVGGHDGKYPLFRYARAWWVEQLVALDKNPVLCELVIQILLKVQEFDVRRDMSKYSETRTIRYNALDHFTNQGSRGRGTKREKNPYYMNHPLGFAAWLGSPDLVRILLKEGHDINYQRDIGGRPLSEVLKGHTDEHSQRPLLTEGSQIDATSEPKSDMFQGSSALHIAVSRSNVLVTRLLLEHGAVVNAEGGDGTALQLACRDRSIETVALLLEYNADISFQNANHGPPIIAALYGHGHYHLNAKHDVEPLIKLLLEHGTDANSASREQGTALQAALRNKHLTTVDLLLQWGADVNPVPTVRETALIEAMKHTNLVYVQKLLEHGADVNAMGFRTHTALVLACEGKDVSMVELLLHWGADVNLASPSGTPLQVACLKGNYSIVKLLLNRGVDVNMVNGYYGTALQAAVVSRQSHERLRITELLLEAGAEIDLQTDPYNTALQAVASPPTTMDPHSKGHEDYLLLDLLVSKGANIDLKRGPYGTALRAAACQSWIKAVQLLLQAGARVSAQDLESIKGDAILDAKFCVYTSEASREISAECLALLEKAYLVQTGSEASPINDGLTP
ncbi:MAG: hypothetical protein Q9169_006341 [Polycauliona sp. 2 TL-2023]